MLEIKSWYLTWIGPKLQALSFNFIIEIDEQMSRAVVVLIYSCLLFSDWNRQAHAGFQNLLLLHGFFLTFWWYFEKELEVDSCLLFGDI